MDKEKLYALISNPDSLDASTLDDLQSVVDKYPYFHTSRLLYTKNLDRTNSESYGSELSKTAVLCADRKRLFYLIYDEDYRELLHQPAAAHAEEKDRTGALLDSFLTSLDKGETVDTTYEEEGLHIVSVDYFSYLQLQGEESTTNQTEDQKLQHHDIIDAFIEKAASDTIFTPGETSAAEISQNSDNMDDGGEFLTETLARIYIKQKKYEQALTIIKRLSLNFPKKSVYFADQIRFLEYLIINERSR